MYVTRSPTDDMVVPLRVERVQCLLSDGPSSGPPDPDERAFLTEYLSDLVRPHRFGLLEHVIEEGAGHRYEMMVEELITATVRPPSPVDLVVLAFAVPDVRAGRTAATYRGRACPGDPLSFAVCDQGTAAAFTALRLIAELTGSGSCRRALLLVVEQGILPYQPTVPVVLPDRSAAVALLCGADGPAGFASSRQHAGVGPDRLDELLASELADLCAGPQPATLIVGEGLADRAPGMSPVGDVRPARPGQPGTGVWWELAGELARAGRRRVVLADYEQTLGYLCLAAFDVD